MKALVAAACIAVLAFVGYYFWGEYSRAVTAAKYAEAARAVEQLKIAAKEAAHAELFVLANADEGEVSMVRAWCKLAEMRTTDGAWKGNAAIERAVRNCREFNYL